MPLLSDASLEVLRAGHDAARWPGVLASAEGAALRERFEASLDELAGPAAAALVDALVDPSVPRGWSRAVLWSAGLAAASGSRVVGARYPFVRMRAAGGEPWLLCTLPFEVPDARGDRAAVAAMAGALETSMPGHRFAVHLRAPLAPGFDPLPVSNAAALWIQAIRRGEWQGRQAVYEDGAVSLSIDLLDARVGSHGCAFVVGPQRTADWLASIDTAFMAALTQQADVDPGAPVVAAACADPAWRLPRESITHYLLGMPEQVECAGPDAPAYRGSFGARSVCMFSDPLCRNLAALWLVEQDGADPLAARARGWSNPWVGASGAPMLPGRCLVPEGQAEKGRVTMSWRGPEPASWRAR